MILPADQRPTEDQVERAQARIDLRSLLDSPGWNRLKTQLLLGIENSVNTLMRTDTAKPDIALDALRRWQIQHRNYEALCDFVNAVIAKDDDGDDKLTLSDMETILQEALHGRNTGDPGPGTGSTGY